MSSRCGRPAVLAVALTALLVLVPGPALAEDESLPAEEPIVQEAPDQEVEEGQGLEEEATEQGEQDDVQEPAPVEEEPVADADGQAEPVEPEAQDAPEEATPLTAAPAGAEEPPAAAPQDGWVQEGGAWCYYANGVKKTGWLVTSSSPTGASHGLQRWWLKGDGTLAMDELVQTGASSWAYARPEGYVVRGRYVATNGYVYLADNNGKLAGPGWHVSNAYGQGTQRYYIDPTARACVPGYSADGWAHYTRPEGYVARGKYKAADGNVYLADNNGKLEKDGWVVSKAYGDGLQRYYVEPSAHACVPGFSASGWAHYTRPEGYVVRGRYATGKLVYFADGNGKLAGPGWVVTNAYGQGTQRYYIDPTAHAAKVGLGNVGSWWFYTRPEGYVVRGRYVSGKDIYLADNNGRLPNLGKDGWVVTNKYGQGTQRYYIYDKTHAAKAGYSTDGYAHYTLDAGYVLRGKMQLGGGVLLADGDGRLATKKGWLITSAYGDGEQKYYLTACCTGGLVGAKTGKFTQGPNLIYGYPNKGYVARNTNVTLGGIVYRADANGALQSTYPAVINNMAVRAQGFSSSTGWLILVDLTHTKVCIFRGSKGNWSLYKWFSCSVGAPETPTVRGTFRVGGRGYSFGEEKGYSCYYYTQFYSDYLFHSVTYYPHTRTILDGRLNAHISHGCIRLNINDAYWINQNIPSGTTVNVF